MAKLPINSKHLVSGNVAFAASSGPVTTEDEPANTWNYGIVLYMDVGIGATKNIYRMILATSNSEAWIPIHGAPGFTGEGFDVEASSSFSRLSSTSQASTEFWHHTLNGFCGLDYLTFQSDEDPETITEYPLCIATSSSDGSFSAFVNADGFVGVPSPYKTPAENALFPSYLASYDVKQIGIWFDPTLTDSEVANRHFGYKGEVKFGGVNEEGFNGHLTWIDVLQDEWHWIVSSASVTVDAVAISGNNTTAFIIDTSASMSKLPASYFDAIIGHLDGQASDEPEKKLSAVDCEQAHSASPVALDLGGFRVVLQQSKLFIEETQNKCYLAFLKTAHDQPNVLGMSLLSHYYLALDYDQKKIGLANANIPPSN